MLNLKERAGNPELEKHIEFQNVKSCSLCC